MRVGVGCDPKSDVALFCSAEAARQNIGGDAGLVPAHDIKFTVIQFPLYYRLDDYPLADIDQQLGEFATSEGIEWIDLLPLFAGKDERDYWVYPRDFHPNIRAHHEVADFLYSAVKW